MLRGSFQPASSKLEFNGAGNGGHEHRARRGVQRRPGECPEVREIKVLVKLNLDLLPFSADSQQAQGQKNYGRKTLGLFGQEQGWQLDVYGDADFYTDSTSYHGHQILRQQPLPGVEGHISYAFNDNVWLSLDTRYSARGATSVNGVDQNDQRQNFASILLPNKLARIA
jgi:hypothetical protein